MTPDETPEKDDAEIKLPYEPPAVVSEETFETLAMACKKMSGPTCIGGISS
ncbi:MAG TPA: hypothetical protein VKE22_17635 [Haliangiales bacterium]|nr:hypothetical protein [Haliangiales bacterium]